MCVEVYKRRAGNSFKIGTGSPAFCKRNAKVFMYDAARVFVSLPSLCASINAVVDGAHLHPSTRSLMVQAAIYVPFPLCKNFLLSFSDRNSYLFCSIQIGTPVYFAALLLIYSSVFKCFQALTDSALFVCMCWRRPSSAMDDDDVPLFTEETFRRYEARLAAAKATVQAATTACRTTTTTFHCSLERTDPRRAPLFLLE